MVCFITANRRFHNHPIQRCYLSIVNAIYVYTQSGISAIAYHFGLPLVVTDVGGLKSTVGDRGTGIVVPQATPGDIREAIERFFGDAALRERLQEAIRRERERLSWPVFCKELTGFAETL